MPSCQYVARVPGERRTGMPTDPILSLSRARDRRSETRAPRVVWSRVRWLNHHDGIRDPRRHFRGTLKIRAGTRGEGPGSPTQRCCRFIHLALDDRGLARSRGPLGAIHPKELLGIPMARRYGAYIDSDFGRGVLVVRRHTTLSMIEDVAGANRVFRRMDRSTV